MAERGAATIPGSASNGAASNGARSTTVSDRPTRASTASPRRGRPTIRTRARLPELVLGVLLVAGGALGAVLWATHEPSQRVLVATRAIQRGESLDASMVRWADVSGDHIAGITETAGLEGRIAAVDIVVSSPLQESSFRSPTMVGQNQMEYGLALDPGDYPIGLAVGDLVMVVVVPPPDIGGEERIPVRLSTIAEVLVAPSADLAPGERAVINLSMARADIETLATAVEVRLGRIEADPVAPGVDPPAADAAAAADPAGGT